jgi:hypothetical protein
LTFLKRDLRGTSWIGHRELEEKVNSKINEVDVKLLHIKYFSTLEHFFISFSSFLQVSKIHCFNGTISWSFACQARRRVYQKVYDESCIGHKTRRHTQGTNHLKILLFKVQISFSLLNVN